MAKATLVLGRSGAGKSFSMRNLPTNEYAIISVLGKELPFKTDKKFLEADDYNVIKDAMLKYVQRGVKIFVIDDASYLLTNAFMRAQSEDKKGNKMFELYSKMATDFYDLIRFSQKSLPEDVLVFYFMHEDKNEFGDVKPKTVGKMLDEKVVIEGLFTQVLQASKVENKYVFRTQTDGTGVTKSPFGMFDSEEIDNDLNYVVQKIREFYNIGGSKNE